MIVWKRRAEKIAEIHFAMDFDSQWGVEELLAEDAAYLFNNMPPKHQLTVRDKQIEEIRRQLAELGIVELGFGEFPNRGPEEGYSCVSIFKATADQVPTIRDICRTVFSSN